jgi:ribosome-binding factor A
VYGDQSAVESSAAALASATGVLRTAVGRQTGVRFTPTLQFRPDTVGEQSRHIEELLVTVRESDAALAEQAATAHYAGEADPYRRPREAEAADGADDERSLDGESTMDDKRDGS